MRFVDVSPEGVPPGDAKPMEPLVVTAKPELVVTIIVSILLSGVGLAE